MIEKGNQLLDQALLDRIRTGDEGAKDILVRKYLPMVHRIVRGQARYRFDYDDLCQEGIIGLLKAILEYDPVRFSVRFSTFAYICVLRRVSNLIKQGKTMKSRMLASAVSLNTSVLADESRPILDSLASRADDPLDLVLEAWAEERLRSVLKAHLSRVEYAVIDLFLQGFGAAEIQKGLGLGAKVVDNARTRARLKLRRLVEKYGSLLSADLPLQARKRQDLAMIV